MTVQMVERQVFCSQCNVPTGEVREFEEGTRSARLRQTGICSNCEGLDENSARGFDDDEHRQRGCANCGSTTFEIPQVARTYATAESDEEGGDTLWFSSYGLDPDWEDDGPIQCAECGREADGFFAEWG